MYGITCKIMQALGNTVHISAQFFFFLRKNGYSSQFVINLDHKSSQLISRPCNWLDKERDRIVHVLNIIY